MKFSNSTFKAIGFLPLRREYFILFALIFTLQFAFGQNPCTNPPNVLENGNFELPATSIGFGNFGINNNLLGWDVSHGTPSIGQLPPRSAWMWSNGGVGEGVFNCYNFEQGKEYLICFDLLTNGHPNGVFRVRATNGINTYTANPTPAGTAPPTPTSSQQIFQDALAPYTSWTSLSIPFAPNANYSQIWFYPFQSVGLQTQSEARFDNVVIQEINPAAYTVSSNVAICPPASVQLSATGGTTYNWSPAAGLSCTNCANPIANPTTTTTYAVEIIDPDLCGPVTREVTVTVDCNCTCDVTADYISTQAVNCSTYTFTNISSGNACTNVIGATWDFGGGVTGTGNSITHTFPGPGTYNVCMEATGFDGENCCSDTVCYPITVECGGGDCECELVPDFSFNIQDCRVDFVDRTSTDCQVISSIWDFGDGSFASTPNPTHYYNSPGTYEVCLKIEVLDPNTGQCCIDSICYDVNVEKCEPCDCEINIIPFTANVNACDVDFDANVDTRCNITSIDWDFGDGSTASGSLTPTHTYPYNGTYWACVTITYIDNSGKTCTETYCDRVTIVDCDPRPCESEEGGIRGKMAGISPLNEANSTLGLSVYPNPSSGTVSINFQTPRLGKVEINVQDVTGKQISTITSSEMEAGNHSLKWDPSSTDMTPGLYYILIKYGEAGETVKFIYEK